MDRVSSGKILSCSQLSKSENHFEMMLNLIDFWYETCITIL